MLRFDRKQQNSVKQLSFNKKNSTTEISRSELFSVSREENSKQHPSESRLKGKKIMILSNFYKENKEWGFPGGSVANRLLCNIGDTSLIPCSRATKPVHIHSAHHRAHSLQ